MKVLSVIRAALAAALMAATMQAQVKQHPIPRIVQKDGRYALMVDDAPYLVLAAQTRNSSAWPSRLPLLWPALEYDHVNTVEVPVYWNQGGAAGKVRLHGGGHDSGGGAQAPGACDSAVVCHMEERQPALYARLDEVGHCALSA